MIHIGAFKCPRKYLGDGILVLVGDGVLSVPDTAISADGILVFRTVLIGINGGKPDVQVADLLERRGV